MMHLNLTPGNLLACSINMHRQRWDGTICKDPVHWECSAQLDFRQDFCANEVPRCFQVATFAQSEPHFYIDQSGASWVLDEHPEALNDQVLLLFAKRVPGATLTDNQRYKLLVTGLYRIARIERDYRGARTVWKVFPHPEEWICLDHLSVSAPFLDSAGGQYLKQLQRDKWGNLRRELEDISKLKAWPEAWEGARFEKVMGQMDAWLATAADRVQALYQSVQPPPQPHTTAKHSELAFSPFAGSVRQKMSTHVRPSVDLETPLRPATPTAFPPSTRLRPALLDEARCEWIRATYGEDVLDSLQVASISKDFLILSGRPGVGKSHLASRLLDDPKRERTLVLPVGATWRGREDLLGYTNPIDGKFLETPFTLFLRKAAEAWENGDRRPHVVVFEEFNLSPPEYWLSDILALTQYSDELGRRLHLHAQRTGDSGQVLLSPAILFVGTINEDHTTGALSPRVLDRAALIPLKASVRECLQRVDCVIEEHVLSAMQDLDRILAPWGAGFSVRTALALRDSLAGGIEMGKAYDIGLLQNMLTHVRFEVHDPRCGNLVELCIEWQENYGVLLPRCSQWISTWRESLDVDRELFGA